ncbi:MAG: DUF4037 domain-containing protein [Clostridia bacterium]|nr:DUF4037 domain-containing protein [Clostridia bacterium]
MVDQLFAALAGLDEVEAIALGGSRAGDHFDEKSDYDVYLYVTGEIPVQTRRDILKDFCSYMELGNHFWEYEDNCTLNNGVDIDILYRNLDDFTADVASVVEDCQPRNGYTTCMWHNLRTCKIIYDRDRRLAAAKRRFDVAYPSALRRAIVKRNMRLLSGSLPAYDAQIAKAARRGDLVSVNHRTAAFMESYFDVIFALNEKTHPGEKRLVQLCQVGCALLPEDFDSNIRTLYAHLFDGTSVTEDIARMVCALEKLVKEEMQL